MARKLRIAASVFFAVLTVALCVLWVRSYRQGSSICWANRNNSSYGCVSVAGEMRFSSAQWPFQGRIVPGWTLASVDLEHETPALQFGPRFEFRSKTHIDVLILPHWFMVAVTTTISAIAVQPWLRSRFSLRTLLITTTLLAVVLGLGVWLAR
ncbi:MAG: hypothetical protein AB7G28_07850 [Pirellulales bacterium]